MNGRRLSAALAATAVLLGSLAGASLGGTAANATTQHRSVPHAPKVKLDHRFTKPSVLERRAGIVPLFHHRRGTGRVALDQSDLQYNGGLYLLFWGTQWNSDPDGVESYLYYYTNGICSPGDYWVPVTFQYYDTSGGTPSCNDGSAFQGWAQDAGGPAPDYASQSQIAAEAAAGADYFGAVGTDAQVVVISPSGTHPDGFPYTGFCAWHSYTFDPYGNEVSYTNLPYVLDAGSGCGAYSVQGPLDGFSIVEGHEFAETQTDPMLDAWYDSGGAEIGDKCAWTGLFAQDTPWGTFAQQPLWDNGTSSCQP